MKILVALSLFFASPAMAFDLMEPAKLTEALVTSFPSISDVGPCRKYIHAETLTCKITQAKKIECSASGFDMTMKQTVTVMADSQKVIDALHKADLTFTDFIEVSNLICAAYGFGGRDLCQEEENSQCTATTYMSH